MEAILFFFSSLLHNISVGGDGGTATSNGWNSANGKWIDGLQGNVSTGDRPDLNRWKEALT